MEHQIWEYIKTVITVIIVPAISVTIWMLQKKSNEFDELQREVNQMKIENMRLTTQLANINENLKELKHMMNAILRRERKDKD